MAAMEAAWTGESVTRDGGRFGAPGNTMLPRPVQRPRPPLWIGGNSRRAVRRAVESADGWSPFPNPPRLAARTHTAPLESATDLAVVLDYAREHADRVGRSEPLTVCFIPEGLSMGGRPVDESRVVESIGELAAVGVDWVTVALPGDTRADQRAALERFGSRVLPAVADRPSGVGAAGGSASSDEPYAAGTAADPASRRSPCVIGDRTRGGGT